MKSIPERAALIDGADIFLDTNVLLYAAGGRISEPEKHARAQDLLTQKFGLSTQVLAEFYVNATRAGPKPLTHAAATQWIVALAKKPLQPVDLHIVRSGLEISERYQLSYWDGAIIAAAEALGATTLYTEDMHDGQTYGRVRVVNPFKPSTN